MSEPRPQAPSPSNDADRIDWVELVVGFACNCGCVVCPSITIDPAKRLSPPEMEAELQSGRDAGARGVWFGGGEPTLHPGLIPMVRRAVEFGYQRVRVQTNGMRLSYPDYTEQLIAAGTTEVALSVMGANAETHDAITRTERSFELLCAGATEARKCGARLEADVLVTTRSLGELGTVVDRFADLGVRCFNFWLTSLHGLDTARLADWVPSLPRVAEALVPAFERAAALGLHASSLHTPPCVLPAEHRHRYQHAGRWRLRVVTPGGRPFLAEESPMEGGAYVERCDGCEHRSDCLGFRQDSLTQHGTPPSRLDR